MIIIFTLLAVINASTSIEKKGYRTLQLDETCFAHANEHELQLLTEEDSFKGMVFPNDFELREKCKKVILKNIKNFDYYPNVYINTEELYVYKSNIISSYAFYDLSLKKLVINNFNEKIEIGNYSFSGKVNIDTDSCKEESEIEELIICNKMSFEENSFDCSNINSMIVTSSVEIDNDVKPEVKAEYCEKNVNITLENKTMRISGHGKITRNDTEEYVDKEIEKVIIEEGIWKIDDEAFSEMEFKEITLPNTLNELGIGIFANNTQLESVTFPPFITRIPKQTFEGCTSLTSITLLNSIDTMKIEDESIYGINKLSKINYCGIDKIEINETQTFTFKIYITSKYKYSYDDKYFEDMSDEIICPYVDYSGIYNCEFDSVFISTGFLVAAAISIGAVAAFFLKKIIKLCACATTCATCCICAGQACCVLCLNKILYIVVMIIFVCLVVTVPTVAFSIEYELFVDTPLFWEQVFVVLEYIVKMIAIVVGFVPGFYFLVIAKRFRWGTNFFLISLLFSSLSLFRLGINYYNAFYDPNFESGDFFCILFRGTQSKFAVDFGAQKKETFIVFYNATLFLQIFALAFSLGFAKYRWRKCCCCCKLLRKGGKKSSSSSSIEMG